MQAYLAQRMAGLKGTDEEVETQMAPYATVLAPHCATTLMGTLQCSLIVPESKMLPPLTSNACSRWWTSKYVPAPRTVVAAVPF